MTLETGFPCDILKEGGRLFVILAEGVSAYSGEGAYSRKYGMCFQTIRWRICIRNVAPLKGDCLGVFSQNPVL